MTKTKLAKLIILPLIFFSAIALNSCGESEGSSQQLENPIEDNERSVSVEVLKLKGSEYIDYINVIGTLKTFEKANLSYQQGGVIKKFLKDKGDHVSKGDTILVIDNDVLRANVAAAKAQYELAEVTFQKQEKIFQDKVNSEYQLLEAKYSRNQAKANYELMHAQYDDTFIKAPFSGVVDAKYFEEGELAAPGIPIVNVINSNVIKIEAGVPERYVGQVKKGAKAKVIVKSVTTEPVYGNIIYVGSSVNTDNRTFPIEIVVNNSGLKLKPELVADVFIEVGEFSNLFIIPEEVVSRTDKGYTVFIENNGIAESKVIDILNRSEDKIAVKSGLNEGENLIVIGYQNLIQGQKVSIAN